MLVGVDFFFGKKVVDNVDFAKYDKVFFCKKTHFSKKVSFHYFIQCFLCEVCSSFVFL